jgi:hypothetical protein
VVFSANFRLSLRKFSCDSQLMPSRQMAAAIAGCVWREAVRWMAPSVSIARLSPSFPKASAASSCSGPSSFAIAVNASNA